MKAKSIIGNSAEEIKTALEQSKAPHTPGRIPERNEK